jgi:type IV secretory pathway protease TraF
MKSNVITLSVTLLVSFALLVYLWNPFSAPNWSPVGRFTGKQHFNIPGQGMQPTYSPATPVLVCFDSFKSEHPRMNDIVVFRIPDSGETAALERLAAAAGSTLQIRVPDKKDLLYLKRVAAVGGSTIEIRESQLLVDGHIVTGPFWWAGRSVSLYSTTLAPTIVPSDSFFALGDNLEQSIDSRRFGPVPFDNIVGGLCAQQTAARDRAKSEARAQ